MVIRESKPDDIPQIIEVLKASLGETSSRKTEEVWRYKHVDNPFGKSMVLVAVDNDLIIGVRALMQWKWQRGDIVYSAFRAVDTATHPAYQRKGVFKKLTLRAIEMAKENGDSFIFNTPNTKSLPGYLKMGWKEVDKLSIRINLINPLHLLSNKTDNSYYVNNTCVETQFANLVSGYNALYAKGNRLFTLKSPRYLTWRYENNPLQKYEVRADKDFYLAGYIKEHRYFKELRISEHIFLNRYGRKKINKELKRISNKNGAHIVTSTNLISTISFLGNYGPVLTFRDLNLDSDSKRDLLQLNNWSYTLGDLELF